MNKKIVGIMAGAALLLTGCTDPEPSAEVQECMADIIEVLEDTGHGDNLPPIEQVEKYCQEEVDNG